VFPHGRQPYWARHSNGSHHGGLFWAPSIYRIEHRWTLYFAAQYNRASHALGSAHVRTRAMVLGVATSRALAGPWRTKIIHYTGQFNADNPRRAREVHGGDIDPAVVRDPRSGQRYIFWAQQRRWIWEGALSRDGLRISPHIRPALGVTKAWECNHGCTIEGPLPLYKNGKIYLLYSAASTWNASYKVGVAATTKALDAARPFVKRSRPILRTANGFLGPGGTSGPVIGPGGQSLILYHALIRRQKRNGHNSAARMLMIGRLNWVGGWPLINHGGA